MATSTMRRPTSFASFSQTSLQTSSPPSSACSCSRTFNLTVEQGATLSTQIKITLDGAPVDVTGGTFEFTAKLDINLPDTDPTVVIVDWQETSTPTAGTTWLTIPAATTATMQLTSYSYQVRFVSAGGVV